MLSQSFAFVRLSLDLPGAHGQQRLSSIRCLGLRFSSMQSTSGR
jgi:hypothetical protein